MIKNKTQDNRWKMLKLKDITEINPQSSKLPDYFNYIDLESVKRGRLINIQVLEKVKAPSRAQRVLSKGDVLFQTVRPYQKNNLFFDLKEGDYVASTGYALLRSNFNNKFLYYLISSNYFVKEVLRRCVGSNYPAITSEDLRTISVNIPSSEEQKAIVSIIEKWDKYIELLNQKIQTKKNIKKYLQQLLLRGELRLGGFKQAWEEYELGKICKVLRGRGLSKELLEENGEMECILYGELYTKYNEIIDTVVSYTNVKEGIKSVSGDVLIPASTTTNALDVATASCIKKSGVLLGGDINIFRPSEQVDGEFLAQYLSHTKKIEMAKLAQGITIVHLYGKDIKKLKIQIPEIEEQKAISSILSKSDEEIAMLEKQKEIIEEQRKYLINNLVTGEIRLPKFRNNK